MLKPISIKIACIALITTQMFFLQVRAEDESVPILLMSHCVKSTTPDYIEVEKKLWQPIQQEMVDQGVKNSWAIYWVLYGERSKCDYYVIESFLGEDQFNRSLKFLQTIYGKAHPDKDYEEFIAQVERTRKVTSSALWYTVDTTKVNQHKIINVNWMKADQPDKYIELERDIWKPIHQNLLENGHTKGWGLYQLLYPRGDSMGYNFVTVDFLNELKPIPMEETMAKVHSTKDLNTLFEATGKSRNNVLTESWVKVIATTPKK